MKGKFLIYIGAAVVIICFFLPWFSFMGFELSGFSIPQMSEQATIFGVTETTSAKVYLVYLVPLLALVCAGLAFMTSKSKKSSRNIGLVEIVLGALPILYGIYKYIQTDRAMKKAMEETTKSLEGIEDSLSNMATGMMNFSNYIGMGLWGTGLGFLLIIIGGVIMMGEKQAEKPEIAAEIPEV